MGSTTLIRTGSLLVSPRFPVDGHQDPGAGVSFLRRCRSTSHAPRSRCAAALRFETDGGKDGRPLRRVRSEADLLGSNPPPRSGLRSPVPEKVEEEEEEEEEEDLEVKWCDLGVPVPMAEQVEYSGGGTGKGRNIGLGRDGGGGGDRNDNRRIAEYYKQMLQSDPSNPLLLMNYGKFLHEVSENEFKIRFLLHSNKKKYIKISNVLDLVKMERDAKGAEECYGRAILASPGDGEVLSLYGKLVWETHKDGERAESYFERAVEASPDDCYVLGSYAHFLWDAEEDEEDEARPEASSSLVEAF
ncbi:hypothetical protein Cni_G15724 [Canna indica]|uniref:Uncharacterized protein n=1 Tax=Canna indica TaxID=4628 RepID=A0AAQ3QDJ6_9LILI|nr:hypothetical protein Cni_G15724 [Canna indica]